MHSRQLTKVTLDMQGGRQYTFEMADWSLDLEQPRVDVTSIGQANLVWMQGPTRGTLEFSLANAAEPHFQSVDEQIDARLQLLDRWMKMNRIEE